MARKTPDPVNRHDPDEKSTSQNGNELRALLVAVLDAIVSRFMERSADGSEGPSTSIPDLVRIVQLRRELMPEEVLRKIEVTWVEPSETDV